MHIYMTLDPDACMCDAGMNDAYIHDPWPWSMYLWCGIFSVGPTNQPTDEQADSWSWIWGMVMSAHSLWPWFAFHKIQSVITFQWPATLSSSICYCYCFVLFCGVGWVVAQSVESLVQPLAAAAASWTLDMALVPDPDSATSPTHISHWSHKYHHHIYHIVHLYHIGRMYAV